MDCYGNGKNLGICRKFNLIQLKRKKWMKLSDKYSTVRRRASFSPEYG
jgi:hypothetical protein